MLRKICPVPGALLQISPKAISVIKGLKEVVGSNVKILYAKGSNLDEDSLIEERGTMFGKSLKRDRRPAS